MITLTKYSDYVLMDKMVLEDVVMEPVEQEEKMIYMTRSEFIAGGKDLKGAQVCVGPDGQTEEQTIDALNSMRQENASHYIREVQDNV